MLRLLHREIKDRKTHSWYKLYRACAFSCLISQCVPGTVTLPVSLSDANLNVVIRVRVRVGHAALVYSRLHPMQISYVLRSISGTPPQGHTRRVY